MHNLGAMAAVLMLSLLVSAAWAGGDAEENPPLARLLDVSIGATVLRPDGRRELETSIRWVDGRADGERGAE